MGQATAFWSLKPAACLPYALTGAGTAASSAERAPHVAFVFNDDVRRRLANITQWRGKRYASVPDLPTRAIRYAGIATGGPISVRLVGV